MPLECERLARLLPCEMTKDYVDLIGKLIKRPFLRDKLIESMHNTNVIGSMRQEDRMLCLRHVRDLRSWQIGLTSASAHS